MDQGPNSSGEPLPLQGVTVVDTTRMLPGAVLARSLLDLGARVLKIEDPGMGDPMRHMTPLVDGVGTGFAVFYRGAESVGLNLRSPAGAAALRALVRRADVFVESFRPGTLARWGLGPEVLQDGNPGLVVCSLPGYPPRGDDDRRVGHDGNLMGHTGLLDRLGTPGMPPVLFADITSGTLACTSVVAALLRRGQTGRGGVISQPLLSGPLQFLAWPWIDAAAAERARARGEEPEPMDHGLLLGGNVPCYRRYRCKDDRDLTVGCLEPKFWFKLVTLLGVPELAGAGLDVGEDGATATARVQEILSTKTCDEWLAELAPHDLPIGPVNDLAAARRDPTMRDSGLLEQTPLPGGGTLDAPGPSYPSLGRTPSSPAPRLGEHTAAALREFGVDEATIAALS